MLQASQRPSQRIKVIAASVLAAAIVASCDRGAARTPDIGLTPRDNSAHGYVDPKPVGSFPSSKNRINGWITAGQTDSIRAHGWDIWQSITAAVNDSTPTFQTWYSGHELFDSLPPLDAAARPRAARIPLERPRQFRHGVIVRRGAGAKARLAFAPIPVDTFERVFAFNRFSASTARYIWDNTLNRATTLLVYNWVSNALNMPLADREVLVSADSTDSLSFVTKNVFYFISGTEPSAVPYWAGYDTAHSVPDTTLLPHVPPRFWKQAVAVDPTGKLQPGDSVLLPFNKQPPTWLKVVPLSKFYHITVTAQDSAHLTQFGSVNGDDLGFDSDTADTAVLAAARPGNIGLMMAMHVTGKEIVNWTWQSYWWSPNQSDSLGTDRPASIPAPWNNYVMTTAYSMTPIGNASIVAFNPYLESSLAGVTETGEHWSGVTTNCMSCHRRAAIGWSYVAGSRNLWSGVAGYGPAANVLAGDSLIFVIPDTLNRPTATLKTDFLWSVALRAGAFQSIPVTQNAALRKRVDDEVAKRRKAPPK